MTTQPHRQYNSNTVKANGLTYLAPCFPPLLGLMNMSNGCVPGNGVI